MATRTALSITVVVSEAIVQATVSDTRPDAVATLVPLDDGQRSGFVADVWAIGFRALMNAHRNAEEARLADVGKAIVQDFDKALDTQVVRQRDQMVQLLRQYFDPNDGQVAQRIDGFVKDGGELSKALEKYLAPEHGELARTLAAQLGEHSPLLKRLSPTDQQGIVHVLEKRIGEALEKNSAAMAKALDPLAEDGAVSRLLRALRTDLEKADADRTKQLAAVTKALDANDEASLLSRLMRETHSARLAVSHAMNPDEPGSPLALLKGSLTTLLETQAKTQAEALAAAEERQQKLDHFIRDSVVRLEERRRGNARSARGGNTFQDNGLNFIRQAVVGAPVIVDNVGGIVGTRPGSKVGDQVLRFGDESVFAGAALVVEMKHDASYTVSKALAELDVARSNRNAQVGLFVMARSHAPAGFPLLARYGQDILLTWDDEDDSTDPYLHAGVILSLGLASRQRRPAEDSDIKALADVEHRIHQELKRHKTMKKLAERIRKDAEELGDELRKGSDKLGLLLRNAKATLKALNVEVGDAGAERAEVITLGAPVPANAAAAAS